VASTSNRIATQAQPAGNPDAVPVGVCHTCLGDAYLHRPSLTHESDIEHHDPRAELEPCPDCYLHPNPEEIGMTDVWPTTESIRDLELDTTATSRPITPDWPAQRASNPEATMTNNTTTQTVPTQHVDWGKLYAQLSQPFDAADLRYRAGAVSRDKSKAQALPYVEPRVYEDRLNQLVPGDWSVTFDPWGEQRIICRLTIHGVTRSSTGEASDSPDSIAGTSAEAQAFKRACAKFGLGRYLYAIAPTWTDYDANTRKVTPRPTPASPNPRASRLPDLPPRPNNNIGEQRARAMSHELERLGIPTSSHTHYASHVLSRPIGDLASLSAVEAADVWRAAQAGRSTSANPQRPRTH